ncbi:integrase [Rhodovulum sulfidophilum]|uniref:Site-specific integrase n=1 Tax=Rhodovulum visakhapatnamense TaxID=364297 RepID=A0ABS1RFH4_9RHOB|nr:site-specific integrase [Rhodovulum visakhapatnamense]MBL3569904.1 site-specific integrase [Rhodovulum visakhapatnamense]MBL3578403.1 site-specific integrase [Rhodovulum visakhapatnamense]OLS43057.1 integrase [Rhodovulum sulfidophilum]
MPLRKFRRNGIWYLRGTVAGQRVYESTRVGDETAAEALRIRREGEILERVSLGRRATATFAEAALTYLESGGEGRFLAPILAHFGPRFRLADIDNDAVNACARALHPAAAPSTINRQVVTPISAVYQMAAEDGLVAHRRFRRRRVDDARLRWLTPDEAERLIAAADVRTAAQIAFLLGTGCRVGEMVALQRRDLHLETGEAWIGKAKNGHPRMVRFPARVRRMLAAHGLPEAGAVFRTPKGKPYVQRANGGGQIQAAFNAARDKAGLESDGPRKVTPHTLRHTWATWYYAQTLDFGGLMDFGGWEKADMANRYRKIAPAWLAKALVDTGWQFGNSDHAGIPAGQETKKSAG